MHPSAGCWSRAPVAWDRRSFRSRSSSGCRAGRGPPPPAMATSWWGARTAIKCACDNPRPQLSTSLSKVTNRAAQAELWVQSRGAVALEGASFEGSAAAGGGAVWGRLGAPQAHVDRASQHTIHRQPRGNRVQLRGGGHKPQCVAFAPPVPCHVVKVCDPHERLPVRQYYFLRA